MAAIIHVIGFVIMAINKLHRDGRTKAVTTSAIPASAISSARLCFCIKTKADVIALAASVRTGANIRITGRKDIFRLLVSLRSEEHTSELQSRFDLVCRLLLEKKKKI